MTQTNQHRRLLKRCIALSKSARANGNTPFGALLADADGNILLEQENVELTEKRCTGHAETALAERASHRYAKTFLQDCTLYTTAEPCAMCSGAIYWANIGHVVYAMDERSLLALTGSHDLNPTLDLPCREVFAKGQKNITVTGPFPELMDEAAAVHTGFWDN